MRAIERAREDIASDRLWKARDRLQGALRADPSNQEVLGLLGEVLFAMGDLPAAGRYWYLTERSGEDVNSAHAALIEKAGANSDRLLVEIPARPPLSAYPATVGTRLGDLVARSRESGHWDPKAARLDPRPAADRLGRIVVGVMLLLTVGVWLLGWVFIVTRFV